MGKWGNEEMAEQGEWRVIGGEQSNHILRRMESIRRWINTLITQRRKWLNEVREEPIEYRV
jgi:hypothetical protein